MVEMVPVSSSWIKAIGHDPDAQELHVELLKDGHRHIYGGVSAEEHRALLAADSIGAHLNQHIKPGRAHRKLAPPGAVTGHP